METDVVIIGGGPAGIACAIWLKKLGVSCVLLESSDRLGGLQTRSPYENLWIPGVQGKTGQDIAAALEAHARAVGVDARINSRVLSLSKTTVVTDAGTFAASFVVIATGTRPRSGGFKAAQTVAIGPGVPMEALDVSGRRVAILGGGDNAFDQARFVRDRGGEVTIFSRTPPRAQKLLQDLIADVPVIVGPYQADQNAMTINEEAFDAFGVMFGFEAVVPDGLTPELDNDYITVDRLGRTSLENVYACGEVTDFWHPCVTTAAAHGVQVAKRISVLIAS